MKHMEQEMLARLEAPAAEGWRPEVGEALIGKVIDTDTATAGGYGEYPLLIIQDLKDAKAVVAVHAFHTVLRNLVAKKNPQVGDIVAIKFLGTDKTKGSDQDFANYKMVVTPAAQTQQVTQEIPF